MVSAPNDPNTAMKPSAMPAVAASARPTAAQEPVRCLVGLPAHHQKQVRGQHGEPTRVERRHESGGEGQTDKTLVHSVSAARRPGRRVRPGASPRWDC